MSYNATHNTTLATRPNGSRQVVREIIGESCTQQHFKDECDVNRIIERYQATGVLEHVRNNEARYGQAPSGDDFQKMVEQIAEARSLFEELPSKARQHFNHNPVEFLDYIQGDPDLDILDKLDLTDRTKRDARLRERNLPVQPDLPEAESGGAEAPAGTPSETNPAA